MKKIFIFLIILLFSPTYHLYAACSWSGNTGTVTDGTQSNMTSCISGASSCATSGESGCVTTDGIVKIQIPAGSFSWSGAVTINMSSGFSNVSSLIVSGAGTPSSSYGSTGDTTITFSSGQFKITGVAAKKWRISNLTLAGTGSGNGTFEVFGTTKPSQGGGFRIDHITSTISSRFFSCYYTVNNGGVLDAISKSSPSQFGAGYGLYGLSNGEVNQAWNTAIPEAQDLIYIENSNIVDTFTDNYPNMVFDQGYGSNVVIRYNNMQDHHVGGHDASSLPRGVKSYTVYNNYITAVQSQWSTQPAFLLRGGTGYIYNNRISAKGFMYCNPGGVCVFNKRWTTWWTMGDEGDILQNQTVCDNTTEYFCGGNSYFGKSTCDPESASACNNHQEECIPLDGNEDGTGYPCRDQIGRTTNQALQPMLFWNNKTSINGGAYFDSSSVIKEGGASSDIQLNRDYCVNESTMPTTCNGVETSYTEYTCPHPFVGSGTCTSSTAGTGGYSLSSGTTPLTLTSASILANGTTLRLIFPVNATINDISGLTLTPSSGEATLSYSSGSGTTTVDLTSNRTLTSTATATLSYTTVANGIEKTSDGADLDSFQAINVTNNSTQSNTTYTVTPSASTGGSISPSANQTVVSGLTSQFSYIPDTNYRFSGWTGTCSGTGTELYTVTVTDNCTVTANFTKISSENKVGNEGPALKVGSGGVHGIY